MSKTFGEILKYVREKQNLSQKDFAIVLGIMNPSTYCKFEKGEMKGGDKIIDIIYKICTIYNIQPNELLGMKGTNSKTGSYDNYKSKIIQKLVELNEEIKSTNYDELKKVISTISIRDTGLEFEIEYQKEKLSILKTTEKGTIAMVSILTLFISEILNQMETVIEKEKFDEHLIRCYIGYKDIIKEDFRL